MLIGEKQMKLNINQLNLIIRKIFLKHGLNKLHAKICANLIIKAELSNAPSHGLARLKMYCERLEKKLINPKPKIKIRKISQSISHVDANNSIGFIAGDIGIKTAIKSAQKTGFGLVGIKNSGHYGLSSFYAEQAVKKNLWFGVLQMHHQQLLLMDLEKLYSEPIQFVLALQPEIKFLLF